tara:strand:- start:39 stop:503 length:465 start_codon:yes stop_codon:yes gene_type:complete
MIEKKKEKKEKTENNQVDLKEILGDIKTVVSGETESLFKVSDYKTIKLKKENLVFAGEKKYSPGSTNLDKKELENLIRKIVKSELKNIKPEDDLDGFISKRTKPVKTTKVSSNMNALTKVELIALSKNNKLTVNSKNTKAQIIKKLKENKVKVM